MLLIEYDAETDGHQFWYPSLGNGSAIPSQGDPNKPVEMWLQKNGEWKLVVVNEKKKGKLGFIK